MRYLSHALIITLLAWLAPEHAALAQETKDNSGTNPAVLNRNLTISDELHFLSGDQYFNIKNIKYTEPLGDGSTSIRLTIPVDASNLLGDDKFGLGDVSAKFTWVPYVSKRQALVLGAELFAPTATENLFGTGKWVIAPSIAWPNFLGPEVIVAPAYVQNFSFAGDEHRADVNRGDFDLYVVYKPQGKNWWITSDATVSRDFENKTVPMSWELNFGHRLTELQSGGAINGYIRPGIGIGADRPYNFSIEVGISVINF